ncbi:LysR family transcriptional regulator [Enemella evansiae]|uniref:LysR family transcriptional regulator n=1 Tax=Enemella evansiae TaxID=2016499 RepID=UPI000B964969|nr:LysR family transcriptional regulator [Enemella evansiae]OYO06908.1 LysR family transcriptional regulator [Enemella evansiae]
MSIDLDLRQLRALVAVADAGGFTAAAERLRIAQSSLSRTVAEVERRLGRPVFERTTRSVVVTATGEQVLAIARECVSGHERAMRQLDGLLAGSSGRVALAALPSIAAGLLPPAIARFRAERPGVELLVQDGLAAEVEELIRRAEVDLAFSVAAPTGESFRVRRIARDRFCCVFPADHRYAAADGELAWAELAGEDFVRFTTASSIRRHVDRILGDQQLDLGEQAEARNVGAVAGLVAAGMGVSVVPGLVLPMMAFAGLRHRPLTAPEAYRGIQLLQLRDRVPAPAAAALIDLLDAMAGTGSPLPPAVEWVPRGD